MKSQELEDRELFDLILRMLDYEPSSRCTLAEAMTHSYFKWVLKALIALFVYFSKAILYPTFRRLPRDLKDKVDGFLTSKIVENGGGSTASSSSLQWVKCEYILHFLAVKFVFSVFNWYWRISIPYMICSQFWNKSKSMIYRNLFGYRLLHI